ILQKKSMHSSLPISPSPLGYVSAAAIRPLVHFLILNAVWSSILVLMFFFMFFLSTSQIRRTTLFIMNMVAVVLGVFAGIFHVDSMTRAILYPNTPSGRGIQIFSPVISMILPIYIDCILSVRLYIVYPRSMTSPLYLAIIFVPVVALKVLRTINATYFLLRFSQHLEHDTSIWEAFVTLLSETPCLQIEWISGLIDNCWASVWFLWRLHHDIMKKNSSNDIGVTNGTARNVSGQLRKLFYLGLSSFLFPCVLDIFSVVIYYQRSLFLDTYNIVFSTNTNFQIIGALLVTIWVSKERSFRDSDSYYPSTSLPFHATVVDPARTWASENLPPSPPRCVEGQLMTNIDGGVILHLGSPLPTPVEYITAKENIV
ncbi:hypothetical protein DL96DRAFT_1610722, partial [Flagelloscypha sp. PMI_526]